MLALSNKQCSVYQSGGTQYHAKGSYSCTTVSIYGGASIYRLFMCLSIQWQLSIQDCKECWTIDPALAYWQRGNLKWIAIGGG